MATVTKTDNKKKTLIAVGLGAAGLGALYLLSRGGETPTQTGELSGSYGGFSSEGGIVEPTASLATQPTRGTDINALLEGINNLNNQQAERQAALMTDYYNQMSAQQAQAQAAGSANDELADRVSNPGGSATQRTDLERALMGYDLSKEDLNAIYGLEGVSSFTQEGVYQLAEKSGVLMAGGASNVNQPTGKTANITRAGTGSESVIFADTGSGTKVYTASGADITHPIYSGPATPGTAQGNAAALVSAVDKATGGTTTAKTQGGGTTQVSPSKPASSTATTSSPASTAASVGTAIVNVTTAPAQAAVSIISNVAKGVSSFFGGLFK